MTMMIINLNELRDQIRYINEANGWFNQDRSFGDDIALLHSEVSEVYEDYRNGKHPNDTWYEGIENKPCGIPSELADIIVRVLDTASRYNIDMDKIMKEKLDSNSRRGYRHGNKVV